MLKFSVGYLCASNFFQETLTEVLEKCKFKKCIFRSQNIQSYRDINVIPCYSAIVTYLFTRWFSDRMSGKLKMIETPSGQQIKSRWSYSRIFWLLHSIGTFKHYCYNFYGQLSALYKDPLY